MILVGAVDHTLRQHLIRAIVDHQAWCRTNRVPIPPELDLLLTALADKRGQRRPTVATSEPVRDGESMLLTLDYETAAGRLGVSARTVRRLVADEQLKAVTVGGCRRIRTADLVAYVQALET